MTTFTPDDSVGDRLLNLAEAARLARIGESTLRQAIYKGLGPRAYKLSGCARWRFRRSDIQEWINAGEIDKRARADESAKD